MSENSKPKLVETEDQHQGSAESQAGSVFDDLDALRKASKFTVKRRSVLVNVPVDKPPSNTYFRVHPSWVLDEATIIKDPVGGAVYFVIPAMRAHPKLAPRLRKVTLAVISIWPAGTVQIWAVPILGDREFKAWKSARAAYELAQDHWTQMVWDEARSDYTVETAEDGGIDHEPNWPIDKTFNELLKIGFDGKIIDSAEHAYVRQLRGLV